MEWYGICAFGGCSLFVRLSVAVRRLFMLLLFVFVLVLCLMCVCVCVCWRIIESILRFLGKKKHCEIK